MSIKKNILIRFADASDGESISQVFLRNYTKGYPYKEFMAEESLKLILQSKNHIILVVEYKYKIIGCISLVKYHNTYEIGRFIIDSLYRNIGIGKLLYKTLIQHISNTQIFENTFTECVTSNGRSISVALKNGLKIIGFGIGIYENFFEENAPRETDCLLALTTPNMTLKKNAFTHPTIKTIMESIYSHHQVQRSLKVCTQLPKKKHTAHTLQLYLEKHHAYIKITTVGKDLKEVMVDALSQSLQKNCLFIKCLLDCTNIDTHYAVETLEGIGFYFCSLWPNFVAHDLPIDLLCLQYIPPHNHYSLDNLDIPNGFPRNLFDQINNHRLLIAKQ